MAGAWGHRVTATVRSCLRTLLVAAALLAAAAPSAAASLRFFGSGVAAPTLDRVVIPIDAPERPADIGAGSFTLEFWLRAAPGSNAAPTACSAGDAAWINGHIVIDRDVFGAGDLGDFGLSLMQGRLAFGVSRGATGATACGTRDLRDGLWHHVAATRDGVNGQLRLYLDGAADGAGANGPVGDVSYRNGRTTAFAWDPFLVLGAEKHDAGTEYPSFAGWLDELRLSSVVRYGAAFVPPGAPFVPDAATAALYSLDEGQGTLIGDRSGASGGPSNGERRVGGGNQGPQWSSDTPFGGTPPIEVFADGFE